MRGLLLQLETPEQPESSHSVVGGSFLALARDDNCGGSVCAARLKPCPDTNLGFVIYGRGSRLFGDEQQQSPPLGLKSSVGMTNRKGLSWRTLPLRSGQAPKVRPFKGGRNRAFSNLLVVRLVDQLGDLRVWSNGFDVNNLVSI